MMFEQFKFGSTGIIITLIIVFVGLLGLSTVYAASGSQLIAPRVNIEATAQSLQLQHRKEQLETTSGERMNTIETQIEQAQQSLMALESTIETETAQQHSQLTGLNQQITQMQATVQSQESSIIQLKQIMQQDETNHIRAVATAQAEARQIEIGLRDQLATVTHQLQTAQAQLTPIPISEAIATSETDDDKFTDDRDEGRTTDDHDRDTDDDSDDKKNEDKKDNETEDEDESKDDEKEEEED